MLKRYRGILFSSNMLKVYKSEQKEIILSSLMAMIMAIIGDDDSEIMKVLGLLKENLIIWKKQEKTEYYHDSGRRSGPWAMHCAGTPELYTPNLDRIAEQGMRFDSFFCLIAGMLSGEGIHSDRENAFRSRRTGLAQKRKLRRRNLLTGKENPYFEGYKQERKPISYLEGQPTYTDILAQNGYYCALSGKWHLGNSIEPQQGFQEWYTIGMGGCCYYHPDMVDHGEITVHHGICDRSDHGSCTGIFKRAGRRG